MFKFRESIACLTVVTLLTSGLSITPVQADTLPPAAPSSDWKPQSKRGFWDKLLGRHKVPDKGKMKPGPEWKPPGRSGTLPSKVQPKPPGKRTKELTEQRTATRTVYRLDDGRVQAEVSSLPVRYRDSGGKWRSVDTGVTRSSGDGFSYGNDGTGFRTRFGSRSDRLLRIELGGREVTIGVAGKARQLTPKVSGSTVTYTDVWDGADLVYEVTPTGVKEAIVLKRAPGAGASYAFEVESDGVTSRTLADGSVGFFAAGKDVPAFTIPNGFMTDARANVARTPGQGLSDKVAMTSAAKGATTTVTLTPDQAWLAMPGRTYPVTIDPTVTVQPDLATSQDAMIVSYSAATSYATDPRLGAGVDQWGKVRSLLQFNLAGVVPTGTPVDSASLSLYWENTVLANTTTAPLALEARAVTGAWSASTVTWNSINTAMGDVAGTASFNPATANSWTSFPVTGTVRNWVTGAKPNNGFMIKAVNEAASAGGPIYAAGEIPNTPAGEWPNGSNKTAPKLTLTFGLPAVQVDQPSTVHATGAELSWTGYADPSPAEGDDLAEYQLHRSAQASFAPSAATLVAPLPKGKTTYTDTTATPNTNTYYQVVVVRKDGKTSASQVMPVKTPPAGYADASLPAVKDATITACDYTKPHDQLNGRAQFGVGYVPGGLGTTRGLIKWDTSKLPATAQITEATGRMWRTQYNGNAVYYAAHALTKEFDPASATWLNASAGTPWSWTGGDAVSTPALVFGLAPTANSVWVNLNLTSQVKSWQADQSANHGLLLRVVQEPNKSCPASGEGALFMGSEASESSVAPRLHVRYTDTTITYTAPSTPQRLREGETVTVPVTVTNTSAQTWSAATHKLGYWWKHPDGSTAGGGQQLAPLPNDLAPGQTATVSATMTAPTTLSQTGNAAEAYTVAWDTYDTSTNNWLSASSHLPQLEQQIGVEDPTSDLLGVEDFYSYTSVPTGAGTVAMVNNYAGNVAWSYDAFTHPSRGPDTSVSMTYNSLDTTRSSIGFGWSLHTSTLQGLGTRLAFSPTGQTWPTQVRLVDSDGTTHAFQLDLHDAGKPGDCTAATCSYKHPRGLHLFLERTSSADPTRTWVFTAPDRTQFFFDDKGYQSAVVDNNGNAMSFVYEQRKSNNVPTKFLKYIQDAFGRHTLEVDYWTKGEDYTYINDAGTEVSDTNLTDPQIIDQIQSVTDIVDRKITFTYTLQGLMAKMVDGAGKEQAKAFKFTYDMTQGNLNAKLVKVTDPRNHDTKLDYYYPQVGDDPALHWKSKTITDRMQGVTRVNYVDPDGPQGGVIHATVTDAEQRATKYVLDAFGRPRQVTDAKGQVTVLGFDDDHNLISLREPPAVAGATPAVSTWDYDSVTGYPLTFRTAEANANAWNATTYQYTSALGGHVADLTAKISPEGRQWDYGQDAWGNITRITDPAGTITSDPDDYTTRFTYDFYGQPYRTTDANGNDTILTDYDATGQPQQVINAEGKTTRISYDWRGNRLTVTDPLGHSRWKSYDVFKRILFISENKAPGEVIQTPAPVYDGNDNVTKFTRPNGAVYTAAYDGNDRVGHVLAPPDEGGPERKTSFTYDKVGNRLTVTEPNGNLTSTEGDYTIRFGYDEVYQLTSVKNAEGFTTGYTYDGAGNLSTVVDGRKSATPGDDFTSRMTYTLDHQVSAAFDAAGFFSSFGYDHDGLQTRITDQIGVTSRTEYDPRGLVVRTVNPHAPDGDLKDTVTEYEYDQVGNQTKAISPRGVRTPKDQDATDFLTETRYDSLNRPFEVIYPFDKDDPEERYRAPQSVLYKYDDDSRLTRIELPALDPDFNSNPGMSGRIVSTVEYYDNDWIKKQTDPFGVSTNYDYNQLGQPTKRSVNAADGTEQRSVSWQYHPDGKVKQHTDFQYKYDATGNLERLTDDSPDAKIHRWNMEYDQRNLLKKVDEIFLGTVMNSTTYGYNENGALVHRVHDRGTDDYTYDVRNLPDTVRNVNDGTTRNTSYTYTPRGEVKQENKSNGNIATFEYFLDGLLQHSAEKSGDGKVQDEHVLQYQENLKVSRDETTINCVGTCRNPHVNRTYKYDPRDRMISAENDVIPEMNEEYTYDANSNVVLQSVENPAHGSIFLYDRNRLTKSGTPTESDYIYDDSGRLKEVKSGGDVTTSYEYDVFDHITKTRAGERTNEYTYDPLGRTSSTKVTGGENPSGTTVFNYLGLSGEVLDELNNGNTAPTRSFEYSATDERLGMTKKVGDGSEHSVYGYNSHGDVEYLTDDNGQNRGTYGYSAYGSLLSMLTTGVDADRDPNKEPYNPYWYNTKRFDKVGNTYDISRGYNPDMHRFLSPGMSDDPAADVGMGLDPATSNRYGFAAGNLIANPQSTTPLDWKKELAKLGTALLVGVAVTALGALCPASAGLGCLAAAAVAGGAAGGAAAYGVGVAMDPKEDFSWANFGIETGFGAAVGLLSFGVARVMGSGLGAAACRNSFTPDTKVLMADGSRKPIADVKVGDKVKATDPATGKVTDRAVTGRLLGGGVKDMVRVTVDADGGHGNRTAVVDATDEHPFWVESRHEWVNAKDLRPGDMLRTSAGTFVKVVRTQKRTAQQRVHNLTIDGAHTYYVTVGAADVLVHNDCVKFIKNKALTPKELKRPAFKYQRAVTGQDYEQIWELNGRRVHLDGGPTSGGFTVEAKWTGNEFQWKSSPYNPSNFFNEMRVVWQARKLLKFDAASGGNGVRYAVSNAEGAWFFRAILREWFPEAMESGRLAVYHVPGNGM